MVYPHKWSSISYRSSAGQRKTDVVPLDHATNQLELAMSTRDLKSLSPIVTKIGKATHKVQNRVVWGS